MSLFATHIKNFYNTGRGTYAIGLSIIVFLCVFGPIGCRQYQPFVSVLPEIGTKVTSFIDQGELEFTITVQYNHSEYEDYAEEEETHILSVIDHTISPFSAYDFADAAARLEIEELVVEALTTDFIHTNQIDPKIISARFEIVRLSVPPSN